MGMYDMLGKFLTQFIVLVLNYIFSKFFVFTTGKKKGKSVMTFEEIINKIRPADREAMENAQKRWNSIAKPLHSLGKMETLGDPDRRDHGKR